MLKIGEFSHLSQVSIKTLRYYADMGLLEPAHVDEMTKHRFYTLEQLSELHKIRALKELGLSLEQIQNVVSNELAEHELRGMLVLKEAEVQQHLLEANQRLEKVKFHIKMIELERTMPELDVVIKSLPAMQTVEMNWHKGLNHKLNQEVSAVVKAGKLKHTGKYINVFDGELLNDDWSNARYVFEVDDEQPNDDIELASQGTLKRSMLKAAEHAATIILRGGRYAHPREPQAILNLWAVENGYQLCKESRSIYHCGPMHTKNRNDWVIELQTIIQTVT